MFFATHRVVMCAGRRIICRPATCDTVFRALATYWDEFCRIATKQRDEGLTAEVVEVVLSEACADERLPFVIDPSIELWGGAPGEAMELLALQPAVARECLSAVLSLTDAHTIAQEFRFERATADGDEDEKPRDQVAIAIVKVAMGFGCSPSSVMAWPYAAFMAARDYLIELSEQSQHTEDTDVDVGVARGVPRKTTRLSLDSPVEELIAAGVPYARGVKA